MRYLKPLARVQIEGLNLDRLFKLLKKNKVSIKNIKRLNHKQIVCNINYSSLQKLFASLKETCYTVTVQKYYGLPAILQALKARIGIFVGIIIFFTMLLLSSNFVWQIQIYGTETLKRTEVVQALSQAGISVGKPIGENTLMQAENSLPQTLQQISMISIIKKGTSVIVNIKEVRIPQVMAQIGTQAHLIAQHEGVITHINVVQGTPLVEVGQVVKEGDILIAGYFATGNSQLTKCIAMGEVFATVWFSHLVQFETTKTEWVRTGNFIQKVNLGLFNNQFGVKNQQNDYSHFEIEQSNNYLFYNNLVPLKIFKTIYFETQPITVQQDYSLNKTSLENEAILLARDKVPVDIEVVEEFTRTEHINGTYFITGFAKCQLKIDKIQNA